MLRLEVGTLPELIAGSHLPFSDGGEGKEQMIRSLRDARLRLRSANPNRRMNCNQEGGMAITVRASENDVLAVLRDELSAEELASIRIDPPDGVESASSFSPGPRRAEPITTATVVIWVVSAIAGGVAYDAVKELTKKVRDLLEKKFGASKVGAEDDLDE